MISNPMLTKIFISDSRFFVANFPPANQVHCIRFLQFGLYISIFGKIIDVLGKKLIACIALRHLIWDKWAYSLRFLFLQNILQIFLAFVVCFKSFYSISFLGSGCSNNVFIHSRSVCRYLSHLNKKPNFDH